MDALLIPDIIGLGPVLFKLLEDIEALINQRVGNAVTVRQASQNSHSASCRNPSKEQMTITGKNLWYLYVNSQFKY